MEKDSDAVRVPLFDGTNYPSWKFRMLVVLEEHEMTECIEEEVAEVETLRVSATDNESVKAAKLVALEARKKKDRKCKSILISRISDSQLSTCKISQRRDRFGWRSNVCLKEKA